MPDTGSVCCDSLIMEDSKMAKRLHPTSRRLRTTSYGGAAEDYLQRAIETGEIQPGERVNEPVLAEFLGVSRTPIREALRSLAGRGLIDAVPGVGFIVHRSSLEQLAMAYEARTLLEGVAAERAAVRATDDDKWQIEQEIRNADRAAATNSSAALLAQSNLSFHELVAQSAHNDYISDAILKLSVRPLAYRAYYWYDDTQRRAETVAHWAILEAIQLGDGVLARERMVEHTERVGQSVQEHLSQHPEFISED